MVRTMITIIDYKSGNLKSISNGFKKLGEEYQITDNTETISNATHLVLPGVGAFGSAMENLKDFKEVITEHVNDDKPFLGICLGQQVLLTESAESPNIKGLDLFKGHCEHLPKGVKVPHMGWNKLNIIKNSKILEDVNNEYFYFVHSYHTVPDDENIIAGTCEYGVEIAAALSYNNLFSTQFHPEKSGKPGLKVLKNFINIME